MMAKLPTDIVTELNAYNNDPLTSTSIKPGFEERINYLFELYKLLQDGNEENIRAHRFKFGISDIIYQSIEMYGFNLSHLFASLSILFGDLTFLPRGGRLYRLLSLNDYTTLDIEGMMTCLTPSVVDVAISVGGRIKFIDLKSGKAYSDRRVVLAKEKTLEEQTKYISNVADSWVEEHMCIKFSQMKYISPQSQMKTEHKDLLLVDKLSRLFISSNPDDKLSFVRMLDAVVKEPILKELKEFANKRSTKTKGFRESTLALLEDYYRNMPHEGIHDPENMLKISNVIIDTLSGDEDLGHIVNLFTDKMFKIKKSRPKGYDPLFPLNMPKNLDHELISKESLPIYAMNKALKLGVSKCGQITRCYLSKNRVLFEPLDYDITKSLFDIKQFDFYDDGDIETLGLFKFKPDRVATRELLKEPGIMEESDWARMGMEIKEGKVQRNIKFKSSVTMSVMAMAQEKGVEPVYFKNVLGIIWAKSAFEKPGSEVSISDINRLTSLFARRRVEREETAQGSVQSVKKGDEVINVSIMDMLKDQRKIEKTPLSTLSEGKYNIQTRVKQVTKACVSNMTSKSVINSFSESMEGHFSVGMLDSLYTESGNIASALKVTGTNANDYFLAKDNRSSMITMVMLNANLEKFKSTFVKTMYMTKNDDETTSFLMNKRGNFSEYDIRSSKTSDGYHSIVVLPFRSVNRNKLEYQMKGSHSILSSLGVLYEHNIERLRGSGASVVKREMASIYRESIEYSLINNQNFSLMSGQVRYLWISSMSESLDFTGIFAKMKDARITNDRSLEYAWKCLVQPSIMSIVKSTVRKNDTAHMMEGSMYYDRKHSTLLFNFPDYPKQVSDPKLAVDLFSIVGRFNKFKVHSSGYLAMDYNTILDQDDKFRKSQEDLISMMGVNSYTYNTIMEMETLDQLSSFVNDNSVEIQLDLRKRMRWSLVRNGNYVDSRYGITKSRQFSSNVFYQMLAFSKTAMKHKLPCVSELHQNDMTEYFTARGSCEQTNEVDFSVKSIKKFNAAMEFLSSFASETYGKLLPKKRNNILSTFKDLDISKFLSLEFIMKHEETWIAINRIFDKDQNGNNREITAMSAIAFILTNILESRFSDVSSKMDTDMITTKNKLLDLSEYFKTEKPGPMDRLTYINIDRSKWATNTMQSSLCLLTGFLSPNMLSYDMVCNTYSIQMEKRVLIPSELIRELKRSVKPKDWFVKGISRMVPFKERKDGGAKNEFVKKVLRRCTDEDGNMMPYATIAGGFPQGTQGITASVMASSLADLENEIIIECLKQLGISASIATKVTSDDMISKFILTYLELTEGVISGPMLLAMITALQSLSNQVVNVYKSNPSKTIGEMNSTFLSKMGILSPVMKFMFSLVDTGNLKSYESDMSGASLSGTSILTEGGSLFLSDLLSVVNVKLVVDQYNMWGSMKKNLDMRDVQSRYCGVSLPLELGGLPGINAACSIVCPMYPSYYSWLPIVGYTEELSEMSVAKFYVNSSFQPVEIADDGLRKWTSQREEIPIQFLLSASIGGIKCLVRPKRGVVRAMKRADPESLKISMVPTLVGRSLSIEATLATSLARLTSVGSESDTSYGFFIRHSDLSCSGSRPIFSVNEKHPMYSKIDGLITEGNKLFSRHGLMKYVNSVKDVNEIIQDCVTIVNEEIETVINTRNLILNVVSDLGSVTILHNAINNNPIYTISTEDHSPVPATVRKGRYLDTNGLKVDLFIKLIGTSRVMHYVRGRANMILNTNMTFEDKDVMMAMASVENIATGLSRVIGKKRFLFNKAPDSSQSSSKTIYSVIRNNTMNGYKVMLPDYPLFSVDSITGSLVPGSVSYEECVSITEDATRMVANSIESPATTIVMSKTSLYSNERRFNPFSEFSTIQSVENPFEPVISFGSREATSIQGYSSMISYYNILVESYVAFFSGNISKLYVGSPIEAYKIESSHGITIGSNRISPDIVVLLRILRGGDYQFVRFLFSTSIRLDMKSLSHKKGEISETIVMSSLGGFRHTFGRSQDEDIYIIINSTSNRVMTAEQFGTGLFIKFLIPMKDKTILPELDSGFGLIKCYLPICSMPHDVVAKHVINDVLSYLRPLESTAASWSTSLQNILYMTSIISSELDPGIYSPSQIQNIQYDIWNSDITDMYVIKLAKACVYYLRSMGMISYRGFHDNTNIYDIRDGEDLETIISRSESSVRKIVVNKPNATVYVESGTNKLAYCIAILYCFYSKQYQVRMSSIPESTDFYSELDVDFGRFDISDDEEDIVQEIQADVGDMMGVDGTLDMDILRDLAFSNEGLMDFDSDPEEES